jgi:hypothetical protein
VPKRTRALTSAGVEKRIKNGRGQGQGKDYKPFTNVQDVPSKGQSGRIKGWTVERIHHLHSKLEQYYFYTLDWLDEVTDVREQYNLPLYDTVEIAERMGVKHPTAPVSNDIVPVTTDFLIDCSLNGQTEIIARTVKYSNDLASERTLEKLEIEQTFWKERGTDWGIVTEQDISMDFVKNVMWVYNARTLWPEITPQILEQIEPTLFDEVNNGEIPLAHTALALDMHMGFSPGTCLTLIRHLIAAKRWLVDMYKYIDTQNPLTVWRANDPVIRRETLTCLSK